MIIIVAKEQTELLDLALILPTSLPQTAWFSVISKRCFKHTVSTGGHSDML